MSPGRRAAGGNPPGRPPRKGWPGLRPAGSGARLVGGRPTAAGRWARLVGGSPAGRAGRLVAVRAPAAGIGGRVDAESPPTVAVLGMFSPDGGDGRYGLKPESAVF